MNEAEWADKDALELAVIDQLKDAMTTANAAGPEAARLTAMHTHWIQMHWGEGPYSREAHLGLAQGYLTDERFRDYYDSRAGAGATEFLVAALKTNL